MLYLRSNILERTLREEGTTAAAEPNEAIQALPPEAVYAALSSRPNGLTQAEAAERLERLGPNRIREAPQRPLWIRFLANFTHLMALLLWVGGIVALVAQLPQIAIAIWLVNLINGVFAFWQEFKAERATEALRQMLPAYATVLRDGEEQRVLAEELVPGDVMLVAEGDRISADARLVQEAELRVNQSTLSGESHPVQKMAGAVLRTDLSRSEITDLIFAGTTVASGSGRAVVFATAMETEFGKIAHLTQSVGEVLSPLQREMGRITRFVSLLAISIGVIFFILAVFVAHVNLADAFIFALGMIVAFVPEGLLPTVTLSLAMGVQRMAAEHALIKRLSAVETLGSTTVICTDKTGTLTQNEMTVRSIWLDGRTLEVTGVGYDPHEGQILDQGKPVSAASSDDLRQLLIAAALANNARLLPPSPGQPHWTVLGDPTEAALCVAAVKGGIDLKAEGLRLPRMRELPFESRRKRMSTIHRTGQAEVLFVKGAPREMLELCDRILLDGQDMPMMAALRNQINAANDAYARSGLRVLGIAWRPLAAGEARVEASDPEGSAADLLERGLTFLGLIAMMDPPRPEVSGAVERCYTAGIRIIMITGDYGLTAESIARRIGIVRSERPRIITGAELGELDEPTLQLALQDEVIFARVAPEDKLRVVSALIDLGEVVAVTGDGVNDAPALKRADIGVAMGITGTDVAKEAADMILTNDNFASIVGAVEEGRAVFSNIRKFAMYVFNSNMAEAVPFVLFLFSAGRIPLPLTVMQVLSIDLGTDMVPAIGLGAERPEAGVMNRPPRSQREPLLNRSTLVRALLWYGMIESLAAMSAYFYVNWLHGWPGVPLAPDGTMVYRLATTATLAGVVAAQVGAVFNARTNRVSVFKIGFFSNRLILVGIVVELVLLALLSYVPFLHPIFNTAPLGWREWAFVLAWAPIMLGLDELRKAILRARAAKGGN